MKTPLLAIVGLAAIAAFTQTGMAEIMELSPAEAASINGGISCPLLKCESGGTCPPQPMCILIAGAFPSLGRCVGDADYCNSASYKECNLGFSFCNAQQGPGGCGAKFHRTCTITLAEGEEGTCIETDVLIGDCDKDCI
jgi:hypothetical protein